MTPPTTGPLAALAFWTVLIALLPVVLVQALWTAWRTPRLPEAEGPREGQVEPAARAPVATPAEHFRLLVVGESTTVGVGVSQLEEALAARLSAAIAERSGLAVHWQVIGANGARVARAAALLAAAPPGPPPALALVPMGVNDTVKLSSLASWRAALDTLCGSLRQQGAAHIAFASVPPVGWFTALPRPLRWLLGWRARQLDRALLEWCVGAGPDVHYLPIRFPPSPELLAEDGYHPGAEGYRRWASLLADQLMASGLTTASPAAP
ncbi:MAG: SGNH/GDSL hydrolase family protein [Gammaproteobacteria bacterium]|nr:SGNH/GDSL hydrolase family protein [Gammaproteobacteria bacterium]